MQDSAEFISLLTKTSFNVCVKYRSQNKPGSFGAKLGAAGLSRGLASDVTRLQVN